MNLYFIDLDGTIEDSKQDMISSVQEVRKILNLEEIDSQYIKNYVNKGMSELYKNCFADYIKSNSENYLIVKNTYEDFYFKNVCIHTKCYEGIPETIRLLSQKGPIIVVTNKPEKISRELLKKLQLDAYITDVMGGDSCAESKPSPLPLKIAIDKLPSKEKFERIFMIGDSEGDMQTALAFGALSIWCSWGYASETPPTKPNFIIQKPSDLLEI